VALRLCRLNFQRVKIHSKFPCEIDLFTRSHFDRDRLCLRCRRTRSLISTVRDERSKHFLSGCRLYEVFAQKRARKRGAVTCNKCDCFINLSACVGRREKPRFRALSMFGRRREKERVKRDSRVKGHISEIFPEFLFRSWNRERQSKLAPRVIHVYNVHVTVFIAVLSAFPHYRPHKSKNKNEDERCVNSSNRNYSAKLHYLS